MPIIEEPSESKLETPIIKETSIVQNESNLIQDIALISDITTPFHNHAQPMTGQEISLPDRTIAQPMTGQEISLPDRTIAQPVTGQEISLPTRTIDQPMTEWEISVPNRTILGKLKTHTKWRKILGSKLVRRVMPTNTNAICRPPSKPPDKQNSLKGEISERTLPYINLTYIPLPSLLTYKILMEKG